MAALPGNPDESRFSGIPSPGAPEAAPENQNKATKIPADRPRRRGRRHPGVSPVADPGGNVWRGVGRRPREGGSGVAASTHGCEIRRTLSATYGHPDLVIHRPAPAAVAGTDRAVVWRPLCAPQPGRPSGGLGSSLGPKCRGHRGAVVRGAWYESLRRVQVPAGGRSGGAGGGPCGRARRPLSGWRTARRDPA